MSKTTIKEFRDVAKCALADLEGLVEEFELDEDHSARETIKELNNALGG